MNLFSKFTRCYYSIAKEVFEDQLPLKRLRYYRDVFFLLYSTRIFLLIYVVFYYLPQNSAHQKKEVGEEENDFFAHYRTVDPLVNMLAGNSAALYEPFTGVAVFLFVLFDFVCQRAFHRLDVQTVTWRWWYELIVLNQDAYFASRIADAEQLKQVYAEVESSIKRRLGGEKPGGFGAGVVQLLPRVVLRALSTALVHYHFRNVNLQQLLLGNRFKVIPQISPRVRLRVLRFLFATDFVSFFCLLLIAFLAIAFCLVNFLDFPAADQPLIHFPWYSHLLTTADAVLMILGLTRMCQSALFFTNCTILGTIVYTGHVREQYRSMRALIDRHSTQSTSRLPFTTRNYRLVNNHLAEHNKVCYLVIRGCIELFGGVLLAFILTHLPVNVFLLRRNILLSSSSVVGESIPWVIVLFQLAATVIVFAPLAWCAEVYHGPKKFIPRLMGVLINNSKAGKARQQSSRWILMQLKYDDLYGRLTRGPKIAINIGPVESITFLSALEFLFLYFGYFLMAMSQILVAKLSKEELRMVY